LEDFGRKLLMEDIARKWEERTTRKEWKPF